MKKNHEQKEVTTTTTTTTANQHQKNKPMPRVGDRGRDTIKGVIAVSALRLTPTVLPIKPPVTHCTYGAGLVHSDNRG